MNPWTGPSGLVTLESEYWRAVFNPGFSAGLVWPCVDPGIWNDDGRNDDIQRLADHEGTSWQEWQDDRVTKHLLKTNSAFGVDTFNMQESRKGTEAGVPIREYKFDLKEQRSNGRMCEAFEGL
ncbi:hypothetical protein DSL72_004313 [Monilinia vaccinii-corymbosi]|uniref:Uncharacterized protein n=1 Tax=Monilinia vaccinii-corymbosi TaxID=61207 RepID=A0A8A3P3I8_9HELO|nr:hypothetical protein DSL72_004313 [Monilinia vaccinii-corymbosi]